MSDARIGNVIFDIGGVVLSWSPDEILRKFYADESLRAGAKLHMFQHPDWVEMDRGTLHEADAIHRFQQRTGRPLTEVAGLLQAAKESLQPIPETLLLLQDLASKDIPLYCLSNMPATTAVYLRERQSFWDLFRGIVISGEIHLVKPDPAIFKHVVERFDLTPQHTVFIDDHLLNIEGARKLGFETVLFRDPAQCRAELEMLLER